MLKTMSCTFSLDVNGSRKLYKVKGVGYNKEHCVQNAVDIVYDIVQKNFGVSLEEKVIRKGML